MSERTQIYLTSEQRRRLDELAETQGKTLAQVIREAVEAYLIDAPPEAAKALDATFGAAPHAAAPSRNEWDRA